jgi:uncharacterized membrane protein YphA (DoxX/SURF4 family)
MNTRDRKDLYNRADEQIVRFMAERGILFLRLSVGLVFLWFGFLKFFPDLSPAEELAKKTIRVLTSGYVPDEAAIVLLAAWECLIGTGLLLGRFLRLTLFLLFVQMLGAIMPMAIFPSEVFSHVPYAPTLEGQYIIKNLVLISAGLVIGATVRGGRLVADPNSVHDS